MPERAVRVLLSGAVQGCGVRPALARLAARQAWSGLVRNTTVGVELVLSGDLPEDELLAALIRDALPLEAVTTGLTCTTVPKFAGSGFRIEDSDATGSLAAPVPRDVAICDECLAEVRDPANRRFAHPFTSCARCGPRYSVLLAMPFDRGRMTMRVFGLCDQCRGEYEDPSDRRFHAQTICCPECGPQVWATDAQGDRVASRDDAVRCAVEALQSGEIVALRGVGGYQLLADATSSRVVAELRRRKQRPAKPLAVLCRTLDEACTLADLSKIEERQLTASHNPIVLGRQRRGSSLAPEVNPGLSDIGLLLPTTALHDRLAELTGRPLICTSGNKDGEPLASGVDEAQHRLREVADLFLHHDRDISQPIDDSVVRVIANRPVTIRCARGLAPLPLVPSAERELVSVSVVHAVEVGWDKLASSAGPPLRTPANSGGPALEASLSHPTFLAVGGHQKSAVAVSNGCQALLGPHVGDLDTIATQEQWCERVRRLCGLSAIVTDDGSPHVVHDPHPDYFSTQWSEAFRDDRLSVWHHHAHIAAGMLEHQWLDRTVLGVAFDGTGLGPDGTIWGGEFLIATATKFQRVAHLRPFGLPGGEAAITDLRRLAVSMLSQLEEVSPDELAELSGLSRGEVLRIQMALNSKWTPSTTSCGRLFDAAACLILRQCRSAFEGQAAMCLEAACDLITDTERNRATSGCHGHGLTWPCLHDDKNTATPSRDRGTQEDEYSFAVGSSQPLELDWRPVLRRIIADRRNGTPPAVMAMRFHRGLATAIQTVCNRWSELPVVLGGGVFQNRVLVELLADSWPVDGAPLGLPGLIPPNDGGLAAGQLVVATKRLAEERDRAECVLESPVASPVGSTATP